jgi:MFS family permease
MGVQMQFLLRGLLAWDLTHRESALGVVFLVFGLSMLVFTPLGGVAADRLRKRTLLVVGQVLLVLVSAGMGIAVLIGNERFWMLLIAGVSQGAMFGLTGPARTSMANDLVGPALLGNAISLSMMSMSTTRVFAPSLAGALAGIAAFGIGGAYIVAAGFSILSLVFTIRLPDVAPSVAGKGNPFADIADGVRYVAVRPSLRRVVVASTIIIMFGFNYIAFMPALVEGVFGRGDGSVGLMSTASSIGAVFVSIPIAARVASPNARRLMVGLGLAFGATVCVLSVTPNYFVAFAVTILIGAAATGFQTLANSIVVTSSDPNYHGRVQSLMQLAFAGFGIVAAPLGLLAEAVGLRPTITLMGAIAAAASLVFAVLERRALRLETEG